MLIRHEVVDAKNNLESDDYIIIKPDLISFISYPYEWSFSQLKNAALIVLEIQDISLKHQMSLKDCSAYNIQFKDGKPIFIDTLSFEKYNIGDPWKGYRQFCQHFLAPLALMSRKDVRLSILLRTYIDGIPLNLVSKILPVITKLNLALFTHIHLQVLSTKYIKTSLVNKQKIKLDYFSFQSLFNSLDTTIRKINWTPEGSEWANYYSNNNYSVESLTHKYKIVSDFIEISDARDVWDLGGNVGAFSRIASDKGIRTISFDFDPAAVEINYLNCIKNDEKNILPLLLDLTTQRLELVGKMKKECL